MHIGLLEIMKKKHVVSKTNVPADVHGYYWYLHGMRHSVVVVMIRVAAVET